MRREEGYYWVKAGGEWMIGEYMGGGQWAVLGWKSDFVYYDSGFSEIDERRIIRPA